MKLTERWKLFHNDKVVLSHRRYFRSRNRETLGLFSTREFLS